MPILFSKVHNNKTCRHSLFYGRFCHQPKYDPLFAPCPTISNVQILQQSEYAKNCLMPSCLWLRFCSASQTTATERVSVLVALSFRQTTRAQKENHNLRWSGLRPEVSYSILAAVGSLSLFSGTLTLHLDTCEGIRGSHHDDLRGPLPLDLVPRSGGFQS